MISLGKEGKFSEWKKQLDSYLEESQFYARAYTGLFLLSISCGGQL